MTDLHERLDAMLQKELESNEQVKQFLINNKGKKNEIEVYGLKLSVHAVIPRKVRHELGKIQKKGAAVDMEIAEQDSYYLLSLLCLDEPFNHPETWELIDEETGLAMLVLAEVLERGYQGEDKLKNFRGKQ